MTARLVSREADQRAWRRELGLRARWLDSGEAVSIAIAQARALDFVLDDEQALVAYTALTGRPPVRTRDVIRLLVGKDLIEEAEGRSGYQAGPPGGRRLARLPRGARIARVSAAQTPTRAGISGGGARGFPSPGSTRSFAGSRAGKRDAQTWLPLRRRSG
jgi:hypothetical protein